MGSSIVGPQVGSDGSALLSRADRSGATVVQNLHGLYSEATLRGAIYSASITGVTTTVGLATTYTGLCLSNPITSTVGLNVLKVGFGFLVAFPAAASLGLMTGYNSSTNVTHTTPVTVRSQRFTGATSTGSGLVDSAATLPTAPTLNQILGAGVTGAITTGIVNGGVFDLDGSILLPPGAYCAFYTSTVSGTSGSAFSFTWEEVAI